jgi:tetratricopeptide (TPR) repeat protein
LKKHPGSPSLLLAYGRLLLGQKREKEARQQLTAVKPDCAEYYEAQDELGSLAARQGNFSEVRRIYQSLVKINPGDYMAWELLAAVDEREKNFKGAEQNYRRSLEVDRVHMSAWLGLGRVLRAQDKREEAVYAFKKADGFIGSNPEQALELSGELANLGEPAWALSVLERARIAAKDKKLLDSIEKKIVKLSAKQPSGK